MERAPLFVVVKKLNRNPLIVIDHYYLPFISGILIAKSDKSVPVIASSLYTFLGLPCKLDRDILIIFLYSMQYIVLHQRARNIF